jgi:hypothetical protein
MGSYTANYEVENVIKYTYTDGKVDEHKEIAEKIFHILILGDRRPYFYFNSANLCHSRENVV